MTKPAITVALLEELTEILDEPAEAVEVLRRCRAACAAASRILGKEGHRLGPVEGLSLVPWPAEGPNAGGYLNLEGFGETWPIVAAPPGNRTPPVRCWVKIGPIIVEVQAASYDEGARALQQAFVDWLAKDELELVVEFSEWVRQHYDSRKAAIKEPIEWTPGFADALALAKAKGGEEMLLALASILRAKRRAKLDRQGSDG